MHKYYCFKDFQIDEIKKMESFKNIKKNTKEDKICFFIEDTQIKENFDFILSSKSDYILYSKTNSLNKFISLKNEYEKKKNRRLLFINTILKINNLNDFDIFTNFEFNNSNDGIYKTSNYVNYKFSNLLKEKNKFYFFDIDMIEKANKINSRIIIRLRESIKNLYKKKIKFIITDTSKRNYNKDSLIDFLYYLGIKDKKYSKDLLDYDLFQIDKTLKFN
ncbi:MAG: hypothetical protein PHT94_02690 [Candidatus Nanoarchaeia archaeon]|nr:hypothetical protein [Candidatus Nanoarchaeia archaeon]